MGCMIIKKLASRKLKLASTRKKTARKPQTPPDQPAKQAANPVSALTRLSFLRLICDLQAILVSLQSTKKVTL